jgi:hypothetical protein
MNRWRSLAFRDVIEMTLSFRVIYAACAGAALANPSSAHGAVTLYSNKETWQSAAGPYSTMTFAEFGVPTGTWLTDQYSSLGVSFIDGSDQFYNSNNFISDGWGLNGALDNTTLVFDEPITTIAFDFPGGVTAKFYNQGALIYTSPLLGQSGVGNFAGLISTQPFDEVHLYDLGLVVDNIYFGPPIPAPGALSLLAIAALNPRKRRR